MKCYRKLAPVAALSFDLDDTLYDNKPVIRQAEQALNTYLADLLDELSPKTIHLPRHFWQQQKKLCLLTNPEIVHDVSAWRVQSIKLGFIQLGFSEDDAICYANEALQYFMQWRNQVVISPKTHQLLAQLAEHFPLVAITNGNVDINVIGLAPYFKHCFHAGKGIKQKPAIDMFNEAYQALTIAPNQLLHIGDSIEADLAGALLAGSQTIWFNPNKTQYKNLTHVPHAEINQLAQLRHLIP